MSICGLLDASQSTCHQSLLTTLSSRTPVMFDRRASTSSHRSSGTLRTRFRYPLFFAHISLRLSRGRATGSTHPVMRMSQSYTMRTCDRAGSASHGRAPVIGISPGKREKPALRANRRRITPAQSQHEGVERSRSKRYLEAAFGGIGIGECERTPSSRAFCATTTTVPSGCGRRWPLS